MVRVAVRAPGCTPPHWVNRRALGGSKAYTVTSTPHGGQRRVVPWIHWSFLSATGNVVEHRLHVGGLGQHVVVHLVEGGRALACWLPRTTTLTQAYRPGAASGWPLTCDGGVPGCRALDVLGELDPRSRANVDHRPVKVLGVADGDQCLAGPDFDAVAVGAAVGGLPPVYLCHITYCDRLITFREQFTTRPTRSVTNSLQSAHAGHDTHCATGQ